MYVIHISSQCTTFCKERKAKKKCVARATSLLCIFSISGSGYFGSRHTHNPLAHMMASEEKQRLQQSDSISSGSTVAPGCGSGGCENKAYDPDESSGSSSIASSPSPIVAKKDTCDGSGSKTTIVNMEMADLTPPQHPKIITNDKIHHPNDFYVSVNEHKKGIR